MICSGRVCESGSVAVPRPGEQRDAHVVRIGRVEPPTAPESFELESETTGWDNNGGTGKTVCRFEKGEVTRLLVRLKVLALNI